MSFTDDSREQAIQQAWSVFRDGPDYQPTDRYDARSVFVAGLLAGTANTTDAECSYTSSTADYCHAHGSHLADGDGHCEVAIAEVEVAKLRAELHNAEMTIDTLSDPVAREILAGNTTEDDWEEATAPHLLADGDQS